jgi:hypothetical protein
VRAPHRRIKPWSRGQLQAPRVQHPAEGLVRPEGSGRFRSRDHRGDDIQSGVPDEVYEARGLRIEVVVERPLRDGCRADDVQDLRALVAELTRQRPRNLEELVVIAPVSLPPALALPISPRSGGLGDLEGRLNRPRGQGGHQERPSSVDRQTVGSIRW